MRLAFLSALIVIIALLLSSTSFSQAQSQNPGPELIGTVHIPYDFWIAGKRLPAGDYSLSRTMETVVDFHNANAEQGEQAFLMPTGEAVAAGNQKLVFVVHNGEHYLREVWNSDGRQVVTSQLGVPSAPGDTTTQLRLPDQGDTRDAPVTAGKDRSCGGRTDTSCQ